MHLLYMYHDYRVKLLYIKQQFWRLHVAGYCCTFCLDKKHCTLCIKSLFQSALRRLHNFIMGSVYESRVGGRYAANLVRAAQQVCNEIISHSWSWLLRYNVRLSQIMSNSWSWLLSNCVQLIHIMSDSWLWLLSYSVQLTQIMSDSWSLLLSNSIQMTQIMSDSWSWLLLLGLLGKC